MTDDDFYKTADLFIKAGILGSLLTIAIIMAGN